MATDTLEAPGEASDLPPPQSSSRRRRLRAPKFLLAIPAWIWFIVFFILPVGLIFLYSFGEQVSTFTQKPSISDPDFENYGEVFDPAYFPIFTRTLKISLIGTFVCLLISIPFAYWMATKVKQKWRGFLLGLVLVPFWTNFLVRTIGWSLILAPNGFFSNWLQDIGLLDDALGLLYTPWGTGLGVVYNYLPLMILPLFVAFDRTDPALREASKDLGANRFKTFLQVTMPIATPGMIAGLLLVFIPLMGDYITASLLGGASGSMAGVLVASQFLNTFNWSRGSAMAVMLILFILGTVLVFAILGLIARTIIRRMRRVDLPVLAVR